jgi:hypothetical protein
MKIKLTLADYPRATVHIKCAKCGREGLLSKARLIAEHGVCCPQDTYRLEKRKVGNCPIAASLIAE